MSSMMPQGPPQMPNANAALLARLMTGSDQMPGDQGQNPTPSNISPLEAVQSVIQDLHELMTILDDPGMARITSNCLNQMMGVQQQMMAQQGGPNGAR